ncbi:MAG: S-layer homology domain-containing protein, partial [Oscillospiraceae bacterium]|nr:S-layer homology domain-containing protein [Oscillospiraceae bacterium]
MRVMQRPKKSPLAKLLALTLTFAMLLGIAITAAAAPAYPDISGHWGETAIEKWSNYDVLHGNDLGTFDPDGELDVTQLAQILVNTFGYTESYTGSLPGYTSSWGEEAVRKAVAAGAIEASEAALPLTRELAAKIVAKAFGISPVSGASKFSDDYAISSEYKPYAAAIGRAGIFNGNDYGELMPSDAFSRAQIMQALDNAVTDIVKENKAAESAKSVILNKDGVTLTEGVIEGDLIIAQGVGDGDITLDGVTVNGRLVIFGGGANSIHIKGKSSIANVTIAKTFGQAARLVVESADAVVGTVTIIAESKATVATTNGAEIAKIEVVPETEVSETGAVEAATVTAATTVTISAKAAAVEIAAENAALTISSGATITSLTVETKAAVTVASGA